MVVLVESKSQNKVAPEREFLVVPGVGQVEVANLAKQDTDLRAI